MTDGGPTEPTPAGWYADAEGDYRWWDGTQWTEHTLPPPPTAPPSTPPTTPPAAPRSAPPSPAVGASPAPTDGRGPGRLVALLVVAALVVAAVVVGLAVVLTREDDDTVADDPDTPSATPTPTPTESTTTPTTPTASTPTASTPTEATSSASVPTASSPTAPSPTAPTVPADPRSTPEGTVRDVFTKYFARDCGLLEDTTVRFRTERKLTKVNCRPDVFGPRDLACRTAVREVTVSGDMARVTYLFSGAGCAQRGAVELVREDGLWLVDVVRPRAGG